MLDLSTFAYNSEAPFELTILAEQEQDGERIQDVSFKSPLSSKISAYLIIPHEPQPRAGLIFGHWGEGIEGNLWMRPLYWLASEPKQIAWYENCNHELSAQARLDRAIFLCE